MSTIKFFRFCTNSTHSGGIGRMALKIGKTHYIRFHPGFAMRGAPTLYVAPSRIIAAASHRFQPGKFTASEAPRAIQTNQSEQKLAEETKEKEDESEKSLLPPPEMPLPGDCCGSGCVRCVWDVYYEELEAHRKILQNDSVSDS